MKKIQELFYLILLFVYESMLITLSCDREIVEIFGVNYEYNKWNTNHHPWDILDSFSSQNTQIHHRYRQGSLNRYCSSEYIH